MICANDCEFEEKYRDEDCDYTVAYFTYPKAAGDELFEECGFEIPDETVSYCVSISVYGGNDVCVCVSPTVAESEYVFSDVDWHDLFEGAHYDSSTLDALLEKADM